MCRLAASYKEILRFNNDQQVREKRTGGSRKYAVGLKVPRAQKIRIELLCVTPSDLFDNPALRDNSCKSIIFRSHLELRRNGYKHKSNSCRGELQSFRWNPPIQRNIILRGTDFRRNDISPVI